MTLDELMRQKLLHFLQQEVEQTAEEVLSYGSQVSHCDADDGGNCIPSTWFVVHYRCPPHLQSGKKRIERYRFDLTLPQLIGLLDLV